MNNCLFEDTDCNLRVNLKTMIDRDFYGYFIDFKIYKKDVVKLMQIGVTPKYSDENFVMRVGLSNITKVTFNGIKLDYLGNPMLSRIPLSSITLKEACLKRYSNKTRKLGRDCYATKLIFTLPISNQRKVMKCSI